MRRDFPDVAFGRRFHRSQEVVYPIVIPRAFAFLWRVFQKLKASMGKWLSRRPVNPEHTRWLLVRVQVDAASTPRETAAQRAKRAREETGCGGSSTRCRSSVVEQFPAKSKIWVRLLAAAPT